MLLLIATAGIGKAIAKKLAGQQLSVVLVALQDQLLDTTHEELSALYPDVTFRKASDGLSSCTVLRTACNA